MIEDFIKYLLKRNRLLGIIGVMIIVFVFLLEVLNNLQILSNLPSLPRHIIVIIVVVIFIIIAINATSESKGQYSYNDRKLARGLIILLIQVLLLSVWAQIKLWMPLVYQFQPAATYLFILATTIQLVWFVLATKKDARPPDKHKILVCEFGEAARKDPPEDRTITQEVLTDLRTNLPSERVQILHIDDVILDNDQALTLGTNANAIAVLFGFYTKTTSNVILRINFQVVRSPKIYHSINSQRHVLPIEELDSGQLYLFLAVDMTILANFLLGLFEFSETKYFEALNHFTNALQLLNPQNEEDTKHSLNLDVLHLYIGLSKFYLKDYEEAKKEFQLALKHSNNAKALHNLAVLYFGDGNQQMAINYLNQSIDSDNNLMVAYRSRGYIEITRGNYSEAEKDLNTYLSQKPKDIEALHLLAQCYKASGNYLFAIEQYKKIINIDSKNHMSKYYLAQIYYKNKQIPEAKKLLHYLGKSIRVQKDLSALAYGELGDYSFEAKNFDQAVRYYKKAIRKDKANSDLYLVRGKAYLSLENLELAKRDFQKASKLNPAMVESHQNLGDIYLKLNQPDLAITSYSRVEELNPTTNTFLFNRGYAYLRLKKPLEAISDFDKYIENVDIEKKCKAYGPRAMAKILKGDYLDAIKDWREALKCSPNSTQIQTALANTLYSYAFSLSGQEKNKSQILQYLHESIKMNPTLLEKANKEPKFSLLQNDLSLLTSSESQRANTS